MMQSEKLLIGNKYRKYINLNNVIFIPDNPYVDPRLSGHADLSVFSDERGGIFTSKYLNIPDSVKIDEDQGTEYPNDVQLNACVIGNCVFFNEKIVSRKIYNHLVTQGEYKLINVNQGYTKCSILVLDNESMITSDSSIYNNALNNNLDCLLIEPGYIDLTGYDYGFVGGCGFTYNNELYLTGKIDNHPDKDKIYSFISNKRIPINYLTSKNIFDIGGAIKI